MRVLGLAAVLACLAVQSPAAAQDPFDELPDLIDLGRVDGWRVGKLDSDDIWLGQACILFKELGEGPNASQVAYRFEAEEDETSVTFRFPYPQSVPDPDDFDWGYLEPTDFRYSPNGAGAYQAKGSLGYEYIDANTVYIGFDLEADAATVERIAAADWVGVMIDGAEGGVRFDTGQATRAVARARRCLAEFD